MTTVSDPSTCVACGRRNDVMAYCTCGMAYCNVVCQRQHWPLHKKQLKHETLFTTPTTGITQAFKDTFKKITGGDAVDLLASEMARLINSDEKAWAVQIKLGVSKAEAMATSRKASAGGTTRGLLLLRATATKLTDGVVPDVLPKKVETGKFSEEIMGSALNVIDDYKLESNAVDTMASHLAVLIIQKTKSAQVLPKFGKMLIDTLPK
jgi:hypothetical protein